MTDADLIAAARDWADGTPVGNKLGNLITCLADALERSGRERDEYLAERDTWIGVSNDRAERIQWLNAQLDEARRERIPDAIWAWFEAAKIERTVPLGSEEFLSASADECDARWEAVDALQRIREGRGQS